MTGISRAVLVADSQAFAILREAISSLVFRVEPEDVSIVFVSDATFSSVSASSLSVLDASSLVAINFNISFIPAEVTSNYSATPPFAYRVIADQLQRAIELGNVTSTVKTLAVANNRESLFNGTSFSISPSFLLGFSRIVIHSAKPTSFPTTQPSGLPTNQPTSTPSSQPSRQPSRQPSAQPSSSPTSMPTLTWNTRWYHYVNGLFTSEARVFGDISNRMTYYDLVLNQERLYGGCDAWRVLTNGELPIIDPSLFLTNLQFFSQVGTTSSPLDDVKCSDRDAVISIVDGMRRAAHGFHQTVLEQDCDGHTWKVAQCTNVTNVGFNDSAVAVCIDCVDPCNDYTCDAFNASKFVLSPCTAFINCSHNNASLRMLNLEFTDLPEAGFTAPLYGSLICFGTFFVVLYYHDKRKVLEVEKVKDTAALKMKHVTRKLVTAGGGSMAASSQSRLSTQASVAERSSMLSTGGPSEDDKLHFASLYHKFRKRLELKWVSWTVVHASVLRALRSHQGLQILFGENRRIRYVQALRLFTKVAWAMFAAWQLVQAALPADDGSCATHQNESSCLDLLSLFNQGSTYCLWTAPSVDGYNIDYQNFCYWHNRSMTIHERVKIVVVLLVVLAAQEVLLGVWIFEGILISGEVPLSGLVQRPPDINVVREHVDTNRLTTVREFNRLRAEERKRTMMTKQPSRLAKAMSAVLSPRKVTPFFSVGLNNNTIDPHDSSPKKPKGKTLDDDPPPNTPGQARSAFTLFFNAVTPIKSVGEHDDGGAVVLDMEEEESSSEDQTTAVDVSVGDVLKPSDLTLPFPKQIQGEGLEEWLFAALCDDFEVFREGLSPEQQLVLDAKWTEVQVPPGVFDRNPDELYLRVNPRAEWTYYYISQKRKHVKQEILRVRRHAHSLGQHLLVRDKNYENKQLEALLLQALLTDYLGWHSLDSRLFTTMANTHFTSGYEYPWLFTPVSLRWVIGGLILLLDLFLLSYTLWQLSLVLWERQLNWLYVLLIALAIDLLLVVTWEILERKILFLALFEGRWASIDAFLTESLQISTELWRASTAPGGRHARKRKLRKDRQVDDSKDTSSGASDSRPVSTNQVIQLPVFVMGAEGMSKLDVSMDAEFSETSSPPRSPKKQLSFQTPPLGKRSHAVMKGMPGALMDSMVLAPSLNFATYGFVSYQVHTILPDLPTSRVLRTLTLHHPLTPMVPWDQVGFWTQWQRQVTLILPEETLPPRITLSYLVVTAAKRWYTHGSSILYHEYLAAPKRLRLCYRWYILRVPVTLRLLLKYASVGGTLLAGYIFHYHYQHTSEDLPLAVKLQLQPADNRSRYSDEKTHGFLALAWINLAITICALLMQFCAVYPLLPVVTWQMIKETPARWARWTIRLCGECGQACLRAGHRIRETRRLRKEQNRVAREAYARHQAEQAQLVAMVSKAVSPSKNGTIVPLTPLRHMGMASVDEDAADMLVSYSMEEGFGGGRGIDLGKNSPSEVKSHPSAAKSVGKVGKGQSAQQQTSLMSKSKLPAERKSPERQQDRQRGGHQGRGRRGKRSRKEGRPGSALDSDSDSMDDDGDSNYSEDDESFEEAARKQRQRQKQSQQKQSLQLAKNHNKHRDSDHELEESHGMISLASHTPAGAATGLTHSPSMKWMLENGSRAATAQRPRSVSPPKQQSQQQRQQERQVAKPRIVYNQVVKSPRSAMEKNKNAKESQKLQQVVQKGNKTQVYRSLKIDIGTDEEHNEHDFGNAGGNDKGNVDDDDEDAATVVEEKKGSPLNLKKPTSRNASPVRARGTPSPRRSAPSSPRSAGLSASQQRKAPLNTNNNGRNNTRK